MVEEAIIYALPIVYISYLLWLKIDPLLAFLLVMTFILSCFTEFTHLHQLYERLVLFTVLFMMMMMNNQ